MLKINDRELLELRHNKKIVSFSYSIDNNLEQLSYFGKPFLYSPYITKRLEIKYEDGSEDITEIAECGSIFKELE